MGSRFHLWSPPERKRSKRRAARGRCLRESAAASGKKKTYVRCSIRLSIAESEERGCVPVLRLGQMADQRHVCSSRSRIDFWLELLTGNSACAMDRRRAIRRLRAGVRDIHPSVDCVPIARARAYDCVWTIGVSQRTKAVSRHPSSAADGVGSCGVRGRCARGGLFLLASAQLLWRLNLKLGRDTRGSCLREVSRRHWNYGRWALAGAVFLWAPWNICYPLVTKFWGLSETGSLRALLNLALPIAQAHSA